MKQVLITGTNSYIGNSFENYLEQWPDQYQVSILDMENDAWREVDFSPFDVVFHVAGIAHIKETAKNRELFFKVNRDLAYETAKMAESSGVKQFIYLSSMSVYGVDYGVIDEFTSPDPKTAYGKSKFEAEQLIGELETLGVTILRPPMVYGRGSKGNYQKLSKIALKFPIFPDVANQRSVLYIENLCEFVKKTIDNSVFGIQYPQNAEYSNTSKLVQLIAEVHGKNIRLTKAFNWSLYLLKAFTRQIDKAFGSLIYDQSLSSKNLDYQVKDFRESIIETEKPST